MKKILFTLLLFCTSVFTAFAAVLEQSLLDSAASLYAAKAFHESAEVYQTLLQSHPQNPYLHYNAGNCYYKINEIGRSIYHYEKALKYAPSFEDARHNLQIANKQTRDKLPEQSVFFVSRYITQFIKCMSEHTWAIWGSFCFFLTAAMFAVFLFATGMQLRRIGFYAALFTFACGILFHFFAYRSTILSENQTHVVIITPSVSVYSAPASDAQKLFVLHEGAKVQFTEENAQWLLILLPNGTKGWVKSESLLKI